MTLESCFCLMMGESSLLKLITNCSIREMSNLWYDTRIFVGLVALRECATILHKKPAAALFLVLAWNFRAIFPSKFL